MESIVIQAALEAAFTVAFEKVLAQLPPSDRSEGTVASQTRPAAALQSHLGMIDRWSGAIAFKESAREKRLADVFVDIDLQLTPRHQSLAGTDEPAECRVSDLGRRSGNFVLLGDIGAGKTTSLKKLVRTVYLRFMQTQSGSCPIVFLLRNLDDEQGLSERILDELGIRLIEPTGLDLQTSSWGRSRRRARLANRMLSSLLDELSAQLFLDGLDEVRPELIDATVADIRELYLNARRGQIALSCRSAAYHYSLEGSRTYELRSMTEPQVAQFVSNWLVKPASANDFMAQIKVSPYWDATVRPLTLSHLCALYERYLRIPDKPKTVYRKLVRLLLEDWSLEWSVVRTSKFTAFEVDRKQEFLERLAWEIPNTSFTHGDLQEAYQRICESFELPANDAALVARELEAQTGLLVQTGFERYAFAHKSIHEYLAAEYLVKVPTLVANRTALTFRPNEFAVATALSGKPGDFLAYVALSHILPGANGVELETYLDRLNLERPDFDTDPVVGLAVLALDFRAWFVDRRERIAQRLLMLCESPNILKSLQHAHKQHLRFVQPFENGDLMFETRRLPSACSGLPLHLRVSAELARKAFPSLGQG